MDNKDLPEFSKIMAVLTTTYDRRTSEELLGIYYDILKQFGIEEIKNAVCEHIQTNKYFPKPSELIALIKPPESIEDKANKAWILLLKAIAKHGYYDSVQFEDKIIHTCIRAMGGWMQVSNREPDTWMHKDFIGFYQSYCYATSHADIVSGIIEKQNGRVTLAYIPNDGEPKIIQQLQPAHTITPLSGLNKIGNVLKLAKIM